MAWTPCHAGGPHLPLQIACMSVIAQRPNCPIHTQTRLHVAAPQRRPTHTTLGLRQSFTCSPATSSSSGDAACASSDQLDEAWKLEVRDFWVNRLGASARDAQGVVALAGEHAQLRDVQALASTASLVQSLVPDANLAAMVLRAPEVW